MSATGTAARTATRVAMLVIIGVAMFSLSGCGGSDRDTSTGTSKVTSEKTTTTLAEGQAADTSEPALTKESCLLSDDLVTQLLRGETAQPETSFTRGETIFFGGLVNLDSMIIGELASCLWDPPVTTSQLSAFLAWAPGDQTVSADELGARIIDRLRQPYESQDGMAPLVEGTVTPIADLGDEAVQLDPSGSGPTTVAARRGGLVAVVAALGDPPDSEGLQAAAKELLAAGAGVERATTTTSRPAAGGSREVTGSLQVSGDLSGTMSYRPGGELRCERTIGDQVALVEIPLLSDDGTIFGYLEATPDGNAKFGSGKLGPSALKGNAKLSQSAGKVTVAVSGEFTGSDGAVQLSGELVVRCPSS
jgi:hypothetical protein